MPRTEPLTRAYNLVTCLSMPPVRLWGRLQVSGLEQIPLDGPVLLAGNHDSYWDTVTIGVAARPRRQIHALAKAELWKFPGLAPVLNGMGQIPIDRGAGDLHALDRAEQALRDGKCIGVFLEGTRSLGRDLRARSGFGRLADRSPEAEIVCVRVTGTTTFPQLGRRPRARVEFFRPAGGSKQEGESASDFCARLLAEIRDGAPRDIAGRKRRAAAARCEPAA